MIYMESLLCMWLNITFDKKCISKGSLYKFYLEILTVSMNETTFRISFSFLLIANSSPAVGTWKIGQGYSDTTSGREKLAHDVSSILFCYPKLNKD